MLVWVCFLPLRPRLPSLGPTFDGREYRRASGSLRRPPRAGRTLRDSLML
jgi:hypothetical protein